MALAAQILLPFFIILLFHGLSIGMKVFDQLFSQNLENDIKSGKLYMEIDKNFSDLATTIKIDQVLYRSHSKYQDILLFHNKELGNVLTLDGLLQLTEWDEFAYHEMAVHIPLFSHPHPRNILIIGGGDGGSVREALKHSTVEKIVLVEIDEEVINASKQHLPTLASSLDHPKVRVHVGDGVEYLKKCAQRARAVKSGDVTGDELDPDMPPDGTFDVIITDNSNMDDIGSLNAALYVEAHYNNIHDALRPPNGIMSSLVGGHWIEFDHHRHLNLLCHKLFPTCRFAILNVPSWTGGTEGLIIASVDPHVDLKNPDKERMKDVNKMKLRLYNRRMHEAAFALPQFLLEALMIKKEQKLDKEL